MMGDNRGNWYARAGAKQTTGDCFSIAPTGFIKDILNELAGKRGYKCETSVSWGDGSNQALLLGRWEGDAIVLRLRYSYMMGGEERSQETKMRTSHTTPHYGGYRWWFHCPSCGKRVMKLYRPRQAVTFACRHCFKLTYESTRISERDRRTSKMRRLRKKMDQDDKGNIFSPFPRKPKGMHYMTYLKALDEYRELQDEDWRDIFTRIGEPHVYEEGQRTQRRRLHEYLIGMFRIEAEEKAEEQKPKRGTLGDVAQKAGVPYQFAKEAQAHGLISPDGKEGDKHRYRYKLASWLEKLYLLNQSGYSWRELRAWSKRRFKKGHEYEVRFPDGFKEIEERKNTG